MNIEWSTFLTNLLMAVLTAAIPIIVAFVRVLVQRQMAKLQIEIGERNYWFLQSFARDLVAAAEQTMGEANIDKKLYATEMLMKMAESLGMNVTKAQIEALIEAAVHEMKNNNGAAALTVVNG